MLARIMIEICVTAKAPVSRIAPSRSITIATVQPSFMSFSPTTPP